MTMRWTIIRLTRVSLIALTLVVGLAAAPASAQSAAASWRLAQAREEAARKPSAPVPNTLRAVATRYELIVRKHPTSSYSDNALWQAAGLLELAYERGGARIDRDKAVRLLQWLKREYPASPYSRQVPARLAALTPPSPAPDAPSERPSAPAPRTATPAQRSAAASASPAPPVAVPALVAPSPTVAARAVSSQPPASAPQPTPPTPGAPVVAATTPVRATPLAPVVVPEVFKDFPVALRDISQATLPRGERVILELTQEMPHSSERVTSAGQDQLTLILRGTGVASGATDAAARVRGASLLRGIRVSPRGDGIQVRLDLSGRPRYSTFPLYDPYRIVIDIESDDAPGAPASSTVNVPVSLKPPATAAETSSAIPKPPPMPAPAATPEPLDMALMRPLPPSSTRNGGYSLARQLGLGVSRVVIDPGHGGHDPGAQANGVSEAELVLDIARRVETLLHDQPGFDVVLTRRSNEYIPLEERTAIANREKADLFLSIHANSSPQQDTRGVETYVLNFASNPQAESVAARENATSTQAMGVLPQLVKAIALNNKLTESRELAALVQTSMMRRLSAQNRAMKNLGVKQAPFVVLIGAQMPSVLAEVSFLTNKNDAGLLKQNAYRQRIAQALCDAVLNYSSSLKKVATIAANSDAR